ncbi:YggS family pyridoxal phosphate-dependent enzyme [Entomomonas moraniae]|uniref:Pyridoxal phosphate homeostasis protein n=1 Tax=Entomomonas moraniae TaxID=2213226 RepID=A0A3S9XEE4_9GAMM|nr:YggS family pyridoxal phosphate-dependent enzyme [Entomomonas moraniae]AZS50616.1 YggS family pyridoxal phosphate-dependent enzyme [Entomomonas moraniae]
MSQISKNIELIKQRITQAATEAKRDLEQIHLLAVSKTKPVEAIEEAYQAGIINVGENYLQEALQKQSQLTALPLIWHFIGPIQSNKTKDITENFTWVHTVDRLKIAERLSHQRPNHLPELQICIQVNISNESTKSGCKPDEILALVSAIEALPNIKLRGLMAIPEPTEDTSLQREVFAKLRQLKDTINERLSLSLDTLSMGMSHDLESAIIEGATWVRIGSAIFGERNYKV